MLSVDTVLESSTPPTVISSQHCSNPTTRVMNFSECGGTSRLCQQLCCLVIDADKNCRAYLARGIWPKTRLWSRALLSWFVSIHLSLQWLHYSAAAIFWQLPKRVSRTDLSPSRERTCVSFLRREREGGGERPVCHTKLEVHQRGTCWYESREGWGRESICQCQSLRGLLGRGLKHVDRPGWLNFNPPDGFKCTLIPSTQPKSGRLAGSVSGHWVVSHENHSPLPCKVDGSHTTLSQG